MKNKFLGEFPKDVQRTSVEWALLMIGQYGQVDGEHHKKWVLDQVARVLNGAPVKVVEARWENGETEERFTIGSSVRYKRWVAEMKAGEDGKNTYSYDAGTPP